MSNIYREYDIRGIFGEDLDQEIIEKIGYELGEILEANDEFCVAIGYDARTHSPKIFEWLRNGFLRSRISVYDMGMIPTPVAYFATCIEVESTKIKSSVMITGSHNPPEYNGLKITIAGKPFYGEQIRTLGEKVAASNMPSSIKFMRGFEPKILPLNALDAYISYLSMHFSHLRNFPYKIAVDAGNGVGALALEPILKNLGIAYESLFFAPDGSFPNHHPDPSEEKNLADLKSVMKAKGIQIGVAFDGDADRVALLTTNYAYKGDELAILFARQMAKNGAKPLVIGEVKCSQVMYDELSKIGKGVMYKTGHSNLKVKLKELGAHLAAEMSGHMFFNDRYFGYDDAIYAALRCLELFLDSSVEAVESSIEALPKMYSTPEEKINTTEEQKFAQIESLREKLADSATLPANFPKIKDIIDIDGLRVIFDSGWGLVRASNTTPVLVTRFEATSKELADSYKAALLSLL